MGARREGAGVKAEEPRSGRVRRDDRAVDLERDGGHGDVVGRRDDDVDRLRDRGSLEGRDEGDCGKGAVDEHEVRDRSCVARDIDGADPDRESATHGEAGHDDALWVARRERRHRWERDDGAVVPGPGVAAQVVAELVVRKSAGVICGRGPREEDAGGGSEIGDSGRRELVAGRDGRSDIGEGAGAPCDVDHTHGDVVGLSTDEAGRGDGLDHPGVAGSVNREHRQRREGRVRDRARADSDVVGLGERIDARGGGPGEVERAVAAPSRGAQILHRGDGVETIDTAVAAGLMACPGLRAFGACETALVGHDCDAPAGTAAAASVGGVTSSSTVHQDGADAGERGCRERDGAARSAAAGAVVARDRASPARGVDGAVDEGGPSDRDPKQGTAAPARRATVAAAGAEVGGIGRRTVGGAALRRAVVAGRSAADAAVAGATTADPCAARATGTGAGATRGAETEAGDGAAALDGQGAIGAEVEGRRAGRRGERRRVSDEDASRDQLRP